MCEINHKGTFKLNNSTVFFVRWPFSKSKRSLPIISVFDCETYTNNRSKTFLINKYNRTRETSN